MSERARPPVDQTIGAPTDADLTALAMSVVRVEELALVHTGESLPGGLDDLDVLQALLDDGDVTAKDTHALQCMGVVLGMRIVDTVAEMDWAIVEDDDGRDPALRYADTSLLVFVTTMISKRVEDGDRVHVRELFDLACRDIEALKSEILIVQ